ncbi:MAG: hypothetical protein HKN23_05120 [Verrucomicrobiales bacterium]|nr:hypothetical protein [Verrucomicrobiales bacterium]
MKTITWNFSVLLFFFSLEGQSQEKATHRGKGGRGMPEEQRSVIHHLFQSHESITRSVELNKTGYTAKTTSKDPKISKALQTHVAQMKARLKQGFGVRNWDPAFAEFREHYDALEISIENVEHGILVTVSGKNPKAVQVAQNHAKIISGFVKDGPAKMHKTHPKAGQPESKKLN